MILIVRGLKRKDKDTLFQFLNDIAKGKKTLKQVQWGDANTLILDLEAQ